MDEKILTLHPEPGKQGVNISLDKYNLIRSAILETIDTHGEVTFQTLTQEVNKQLTSTFDGSISWYVTTVKLDLEARGVIERVPDVRPQKVRRTDT